MARDGAVLLRALRAARAAATGAVSRFGADAIGDAGERLWWFAEANRRTGFLPARHDIPAEEVITPSGRTVVVLLNPRRADPTAPAPLPAAPEAAVCPLCDLPFSQIECPLDLAGEAWFAAPSPARYTEREQWTVATRSHRSQELADRNRVAGLLAAMAAVLETLPDHLAGFNSVAAGSSVVMHRHFHLLHCPDPAFFPVLRDGPPASVIARQGTRQEVLDALLDLWESWRREAGEQAAFNLVLLPSDHRWTALFAPRWRDAEELPGLGGSRAGFMEAALGAVILKQPQVIEAFREGRLDGAAIEAALRAIAPAAVVRFVRRAAGDGDA